LFRFVAPPPRQSLPDDKGACLAAQGDHPSVTAAFALKQAAPGVGWAFTFAAAAYNLARLPKLLAEPA
jgi:hypothetical protein